MADHQGDAALRALLEKFTGRVRAQIRQHRLDRHGIDADDVEQEVRIRLWHALQRDPNALLPASYIQRTVMSVLVDAVRRAEARPSEPLPEPGLGVHEPAAPDESTPDRVVVDRQFADALALVIGELPERRRRPLQLYLQGFTVPEVAELCGLTFDAGRKLVYRALDEVKTRLRALGWENDDGSSRKH